MRLPRYIYKELVRRAIEGIPNEVCGVIVVTQAGVMEVIEVPNVAEKPTRQFAFDPKAQLDVIRTIHRDRTRLAFIWHSHAVGSHLPSPTDLESAMQQDPKIIHLVIFHDEIFAYQIAHGWSTYRIVDLVIDE